ncbi:MAG: oxidoreductase, partial [Microcella sp.]
GATIVGPRAGETLGEASLAVTQKLTTSALGSTTHAYPTYSDALWNAAIADVRARLERPGMRRAIGLLRRLRALTLR